MLEDKVRCWVKHCGHWTDEADVLENPGHYKHKLLISDSIILGPASLADERVRLDLVNKLREAATQIFTAA